MSSPASGQRWSAAAVTSERIRASASAFVLLCGIPLWMLVSVEAHQLGLATLLSYAICFYSAIRLIFVGSDKLPCQTMFWLFVYVFLGAAPLAQSGSGRYPWGGSYTTMELVSAFTIIALGMLAFDLGLRIRPRGRSQVSQPGGGFPEWRRRRLMVACIAVLATSSLAVLQLGGPEVFLQTRVELGSSLSDMDSSQSTFLRFIAITPVFAVFVVLLRVTLKAGTGRWPLAMLLCLVVTGSVMVFVNNPVSAPRFQVGAVALGSFFCVKWTGLHALFLRLGLVLSMLVLFPIADAFRVSRDVDLGLLTQGMLEVSESVAANPDFDAFQQVVNAVRAVDASGHQYGTQLGGTALFWVPRRLWSDKPLHTGQWLAHEVGYVYDNLSAPLWAELFIDGSLFLVFVGFLAFGFCAGRLDRALCCEESGTTSVTFLGTACIVTAAYMFFLLRGALMPAVAYTLPAFLVVVAIFLPRIRVGGSAVCARGASQ